MRPLAIALRVTVGLALGLAIAEAAFWYRDGGAFPHVNFYQADPALGTRLRPHAVEQISFSGNPIHTARTNGRGFRGAEWAGPPAGTREVLVVGDSQVFGLGVEEDQTFSAALAKKLGRPVLNAGVPTYGPPEYLATARAIIEQRPSIDTLILGLNMANDVFEAAQPNRDRHAVWDGWAVRTETAPRTAPLAFPGRGWLMGRSHLVFALRGWWNARAAHEPEGGFPSEGGWSSLVSEGKTVEQHQKLERELAEDAVRKLNARNEAATALREANEEVFENVIRHRDEATTTALKALAKYEGDPRDILESRFAESARRIDYTGQALLHAAVSLRKNEAALRAVPALARDRDLTSALATRQAAEDRLREAEAATSPATTSSAASPLGPIVRETAAYCAAHGVTLIVLVLPLDVQVSSDEWKKYGLPPTDLSSTLALNRDTAAQAAQLGVRAVDPLPALAGTTGAFLHGDLHLTPRGHQVVADAIADVMSRPPAPPALHGPHDLPPGRSYAPSHESWRLAPEVVVRGSSKAQCETKIIREWFRMICKSAPDRRPTSVVNLSGGGAAEALVFMLPGPDYDAGDQLMDLGLLVPLVPGQPFAADVVWTTSQQRLTLTSPADMAFGEVVRGKHELAAREAYAMASLSYEDHYGRDPHCEDRTNYQACQIGGAPHTLPCADGYASFGVVPRCVPACGDGKPACAAGLTCRAWHGDQGCVP